MIILGWPGSWSRSFITRISSITLHGQLFFPVSSKDDTHQILSVAYISWCGQGAHNAENMQSQFGITELICSVLHTHTQTRRGTHTHTKVRLQNIDQFRVFPMSHIVHNTSIPQSKIIQDVLSCPGPVDPEPLPFLLVTNLWPQSKASMDQISVVLRRCTTCL